MKRFSESVSVLRWDFVFTVIFILFCLMHYLSMRPLWLDEDLVYQCLARISAAGLFEILPDGQIFPRFQLAIIKIISQWSSYGLLPVRFFSFAAMISAVILWYKIYSRQKMNGIYLALLMLSWACSYRMTYYSAELKPYAMDVMVIAVYLFYVQRMRDITPENRTRFILGAIFMPIVLLFSYTGWLVSWIVPFNCLLLIRKDRVYPLLLSLSFLSTAAAFSLFYKFDLQYSIQMHGTGLYWKDSFLCYGSAGCFFDTLGDGIKKLATYWYGTNKAFIKAAVIFIPFFLYGLFRFGVEEIKKEKGIFTIAGLGLVLFAELFVLASLQKYPFTGERVTLFFAPFVFYFIVRSFGSLKNIKYLYYLFGGYYAVYCSVCLVNTFFIYLELYTK